VGSAYVEGYSHALGLTYLARLQPVEYGLLGAEILLLSSYVLVLLVPLVVLAFFRILMPVGRTRIRRAWELPAFSMLIPGSSIFLLAFTLRTMNASRDLITRGACPVTGQGSDTIPFGLFCGALVVACFGFFFFEPRLLRLTCLVWGIVASGFVLYGFGWVFGADRFYERFQIVEVRSSSLLPPGARLLVLGADDKNLVVLTTDVNRARHPEPSYFLRSEIKNFRVVGTASINDFICNVPTRPSSPAGH
jgi:hypothetical protein